MRSLPVLVAATLMLGPVAASAQLSYDYRPTQNPYSRLFGGPEAGQKTPALPDRGSSRQEPPLRAPRVVCGMRILPADPSIDSKMRVGPPDTGTAHSMRSLTPPLCWPE